jgi:hypothetical protein
MNKLWAFVDGKKLYGLGVAMVLAGLSGMYINWYNGHPIGDADWQLVIGGWAIIGGKSAIKKLEPK